MNQQFSFSKWLKGDENPAIYIKTYIFTLFIFIFGNGIAWIFFPSSYSILVYEISDLGSPIQNPIGSIFFNLGLFLGGFMNLPHIIFLSKSIDSTPKWINRMGTFLLCIGTMGQVTIAIIPKTPDTYTKHFIGASMILGGFLGGFLVMMPIFIKLLREKNDWPKFYLIAQVYLPFFIVGYLMIAYIVIPMMNSTNPNPNAENFEMPPLFPVIEWSSLIIILNWCFSTIISRAIFLKTKGEPLNNV